MVMEKLCYISFICFAVYIVSNVFGLFTETIWVYRYVYNALMEYVMLITESIFNA